MLLTKGGRITESSLSKFLSDRPEKIPYETLSPDMRRWLQEMGYPAHEESKNGDGGAGSPWMNAARKPAEEEESKSCDLRQAATG